MMQKIIDKKAQGRRNRASGQRFELFVRKDLTEKGWIVDKWSNTIEFSEYEGAISSQLIPAKRKYAGPGRPMAIGTGFPDFIAFRRLGEFARPFEGETQITGTSYEVIGVECKVGKYLDKEEKSKCQWYLDNNIFSKILIAWKSKEGRKIKINYLDFLM